VVRRHELTDQAWAEIAPLLPSTGRPGGQWAEHRRVVNGILWKLATGVPWRDLPVTQPELILGHNPPFIGLEAVFARHIEHVFFQGTIE